jgi:protein TonB
MASRESRGFDTDSLPQKLDFPQPVYPPELRRRGITGLVKLRVRVGADGRVKRASVFRTSGYQAFDRAALEAIGRWRFEPARRGGVAVEMEIAVPIRFVIEAAAD